jgi:hypothetical protein
VTITEGSDEALHALALSIGKLGNAHTAATG